LLPKVGVVTLGALAAYWVKALAGAWLDGSQYAATTVFGIGVVLLGELPSLAGLLGQALDHVAE